ncbi:MAG: ABC transporter permease [Spirochaetaceae bacterium]|jgi:inositol transport system permease protein|nr:ABC transporter permease [Spirochaetaceae bacterium]
MPKRIGFSVSRLTYFVSKNSIFVILVAVFLISALLNKNFLSLTNLSNILKQNSVIAILAFGETLLIIAGLIDLSNGAVLALSGVLAVSVYKVTGSMLLAASVGLTIGIFCNVVSGVLTSIFKTPPFIATLAVMTMARGLVLLYTAGQSIYQIGGFVTLGQGSLFYIPIPIIFMVLILFVTWYILNNTRLGRSLYAIGGNEEAANVSGIRVSRSKFTVYLINGVFVGLAGIIFMSRNNAGLPAAAQGYEFEALTAAVIGGTSFSGGIGTAMGTLAGAFIVGILNNIMNLIGVNSYVQQIIKGIIIALAVIMDIRAKNNRSKPKKLSAGIDRGGK